MREQITLARRQLLVEKAPTTCLETLQPFMGEPPSDPFSLDERVHLQVQVLELAALSLQSLKRYPEAADLFRHIGRLYQAGYCMLLAGEPNDVIPDWRPLADAHPGHWVHSLYGMLTRNLQVPPKLTQLRAYLELDIGNWVEAGRLDYVEHTCAYIEFLSTINVETPKFIAKGLIYHDLLPQAAQLCQLALRLIPYDPEVYFLIAEIERLSGDADAARFFYQQTLRLYPQYQAAQARLEQFSFNRARC
jgi:tetratricopeptide (TPR) repeat protein